MRRADLAMREVRPRDWDAGDAAAIAPVLEPVINRGRQPGLGSVAAVITPDQLRAAFTPVQTERLLLRAVNTADVDAVFAIHGNPWTYRFHPDGVARSREESAAQLARWQREWHEVGFGFWAVTTATDRRVVGFGGLTRRTFHERSVLNTYYRFDPSAWGHGYATEMASAAAALARKLLPELPMIVRTRPGNLAARAVAEKLGLVRAVDLDDHLLTYVSHWNGCATSDPELQGD